MSPQREQVEVENESMNFEEIIDVMKSSINSSDGDDGDGDGEGNERVLIVDDDFFQLEIIRQILKRGKIPSVRATSGREALDKVRNRIRQVALGEN